MLFPGAHAACEGRRRTVRIDTMWGHECRDNTAMFATSMCFMAYEIPADQDESGNGIENILR